MTSSPSNTNTIILKRQAKLTYKRKRPGRMPGMEETRRNHMKEVTTNHTIYTHHQAGRKEEGGQKL